MCVCVCVCVCKEALALDLDPPDVGEARGPRSVSGSPVPAARLGWEGVGDGLAAASPAGQWPEGLAGREKEVFFFFSSILVTILQLGYGRNPGLDAVTFKAAVLTSHLKK